MPAPNSLNESFLFVASESQSNAWRQTGGTIDAGGWGKENLSSIGAPAYAIFGSVAEFLCNSQSSIASADAASQKAAETFIAAIQDKVLGFYGISLPIK